MYLFTYLLTYFSQVIPALAIVSSFSQRQRCFNVLPVIFLLLLNTSYVAGTKRCLELIVYISCHSKSQPFLWGVLLPFIRECIINRIWLNATGVTVSSRPFQLIEQKIHVTINFFIYTYLFIHISVCNHYIYIKLNIKFIWHL